MMSILRLTLVLGWVALATVADAQQIFPFPSNTIVEGENAQAGEFPSNVVFSGGVLCGGVLVHEDIVLTAAHCIDGETPPQVRIGGITSGTGELINVEDSIVHPNYGAQQLINDIAILILAQPSAAPIATYNAEDDTPEGGESVMAMGYGRTDPNSGGGSSTLQKLDMTIVGDDECSDRYEDHDPDFNLCADTNNGGICFGDSGGPLLDDGGMVLGVASFIIQTCDSNFPDFYTRVSSYSTWLERSICEESANPPNDGTCENVGDDDGPGDGSDCALLDFFLDLCEEFLGGGDIFGFWRR